MIIYFVNAEAISTAVTVQSVTLVIFALSVQNV